jgi:hypothetical protein
MQYLKVCIVAICLTFAASSMLGRYNSILGEKFQYVNYTEHFLGGFNPQEEHGAAFNSTIIHGDDDKHTLVIDKFAFKTTIVPERYTWTHQHYVTNETSFTVTGSGQNGGYVFQFSFNYNYTNLEKKTTIIGTGTIDITSVNLGVTKLFRQGGDLSVNVQMFFVTNFGMSAFTLDDKATDEVKTYITTVFQNANLLKPLSDMLDYCLETDGTKWFSDKYLYLPITVTGFKSHVTVLTRLINLPVIKPEGILYSYYPVKYYEGGVIVDIGVDNTTNYNMTHDDGDLQLFVHNKLFFDLLQVKALSGDHVTYTDADADAHGLPIPLTINELGEFWPEVYDVKPRSHKLRLSISVGNSAYIEKLDSGLVYFTMNVFDDHDNDSLIVINFIYSIKWNVSFDKVTGLNFSINAEDVSLVKLWTDDIAGFDTEEFIEFFDELVKNALKTNGGYSIFAENSLDDLVGTVNTFTPKDKGFLLSTHLLDSEQDVLKFLEY